MSIIAVDDRPTGQIKIAVLALAGLVLVALMAGNAGGTRLALASLVGGFAGFALYHSSFGFTAAWRRIVTERRGSGLRAQILLILLTAAISFPLIAYGRDFGWPTGGFVFPFGVAAAFGAFIFGVGMQLGSGCASGTLFTVGGGSTRMVITLAFFVAGSLGGTAHLSEWNALPKFPAFSMVKSYGPLAAFAITALILGTVWVASVIIERRSHGTLDPGRKTESYLRGPWSPHTGAIAIAIVGIFTFLILGRPWGITSAFALWGAKIASSFGVPVENWTYWTYQAGALNRTVFADGTSVMNFGIMLGALFAATLAGRFAPLWTLNGRDISTAIIGGLLMGYGARLAYGCNIGAYLGGLVSGSLHGWGWLIFGFIGSLFGTMIRRRVGMTG